MNFLNNWINKVISRKQNPQNIVESENGGRVRHIWQYETVLSCLFSNENSEFVSFPSKSDFTTKSAFKSSIRSIRNIYLKIYSTSVQILALI